MEVILSIVAGLGLRLFLASASDEGNSYMLTTTLLGVWEGVVVHQVSGRSEYPKFDHLLAFGLRIVIDLLVSKDLQRMVMIVLSSGIAAAVSESLMPYAILRSDTEKTQVRETERRHKPVRPEVFSVPILSTPLPPRIRAYKAPELLPVTSTPAPIPQDLIQSAHPFAPPTPSNSWLHEADISTIYSPAPKPVQVPVIRKPESTSADPEALPVRPQLNSATILKFDSPPPIPVPLPTPPESLVPSDGQPDDSKNDSKSRFETRLYTIPENSEGDSPPADAEAPNRGPVSSDPVHISPTTVIAPLPVPNSDIRTLPSRNLGQMFANASGANVIFSRPFSPGNSPPGPAPLPIPVRVRQQKSPEEEDGSTTEVVDDGDMLRTPVASGGLLWNADIDADLDPLQTPQQHAENMLSPLTLDVKSGLDSQSEFSRDPTPARDEPESATIENLAIPGSLSQNSLLQPPLPPSGPLIRKPIPPADSSPSPPISSPSGLSDDSVLSTRIPSKLYSRGDELRQKARQSETYKAQIEEQCKKAEKEGRPIDALSLRVKVRDLDQKALMLHKKAERRYYAARNTVDISDRIDVHGLRPREALDHIERTIIKASGEGKSAVRVIVGKGRHSVNQQPALKPAVQREMHRLGLHCEVDARNQGILIITLPRLA